jgi:hypothetical protein
LTDIENYARLQFIKDMPNVKQRGEKMLLTVIDNMERRDIMGDKGGKKDKEKGQKQNTEKQKQKSKNKTDKQPKRKP